MGQPASKLGPLSACQQNVIRMAFQWWVDNGPIARAYWVSISFESYMYLFLDPGYVLFAKRKDLDVHKIKQKRDRNRTTTSLVLDSSMQRGRRDFRLKPANLVAFIVSI